MIFKINLRGRFIDFLVDVKLDTYAQPHHKFHATLS